MYLRSCLGGFKGFAQLLLSFEKSHFEMFTEIRHREYVMNLDFNHSIGNVAAKFPLIEQ